MRRGLPLLLPGLVLVVATALLTAARAAADEEAAALVRTTTHGPVTATVHLAPEAPLIGDAVTLRLEVVAEPDVEVLLPEFGEALERYRILDFVPREALDDEGRAVFTQVYRLEPPHSGPHAIPPLLVEFVDRRPGKKPAPEGLDAYELLTERLDFEVGSVLPDDADADLEPPLGRLETVAPPAPVVWPWFVGGLVLLAALAPWLLRQLAAWRRRARRRSAYDVARSRLERLLARPHPDGLDAMDAFYVELSAIVRRYLEIRYEVRAPEMSTEEFLEAASRSPDLGRDHQHLLRGFLRQADLVKFAHVEPSRDEFGESVAAARRFLDETREDAPLLDEEAETLLEEAPHA